MRQATALRSSSTHPDAVVTSISRDPHRPLVYAPGRDMDTDEVVAAQSLAEIFQPLRYDGHGYEVEPANCITDGPCVEARTQDCTEACHPCEEPHACTDDDCCDPRSVCLDPSCNIEAELDSFCLPCHEHLDLDPANKQHFLDSECDYQSMLGLDWSQPARQEAHYTYPDDQNGIDLDHRSHNGEDMQYSHAHGDEWLDIQNFHNGMDCFQLGHDPSFHTMPPDFFMEQTHIGTPHFADPRSRTRSQVVPCSLRPIVATPRSTPFTASASDMTRPSSRNSFPSQTFEFTATPSSPTSPTSTGFSSRPTSSSLLPCRCQWCVVHCGFHSICGFTAKTAKELHDHIIEKHITAMGGRGSAKHEKEPMICQWRGCKSAEDQKVWTALQHIKDHMLCHSQVRETCEDCGKELRDKKALKAHQAVCGNEDNHAGFKCDICGKVLKSPSTLKQHMNQHNGKVFKCDECGHTCADQSNLRKHKRIHQRDQHKTWKCQCCDKAFPNAYNRNRHEETMAKKGHRFVKSVDMSALEAAF